jgi:hypothetical protein
MSDQRGEELDEATGGAEFPPDRPLGAEEYGTTAAEERWDEPLEERLAREEPDVPAAGDGPPLADEPDDPTEPVETPPAEEAALHVEPER